MWRVQLFQLNYNHLEYKALAEVLDSQWLTMGERVLQFEQRFAAYLGEDTTCIAVASGTAALHLALIGLGIGPGDEVLTPALTFVADTNSILLTGATPQLVDVCSLEDWTIDPKDVASALTERTRAILAVHFAGVPCNMDGLRAVVEEENHRRATSDRAPVALIEDSAHAPGAEYRSRKCGTFGQVACFSFFTNKNLSVGEGGMLATRSPSLAKRLRLLRSHGMTAPTLDRHRGRSDSYDVAVPGLNYRMDELHAALGLVQLEKLDPANECRRMLVAAYTRTLSSIPGISVPFTRLPGRLSAAHIFPVLLPSGSNRSEIIRILRHKGVQTSIHYPPMSQFTAFRRFGFRPTPRSDEISSRELTLPLYPTMRRQDVDYVCLSLREAISK